MESNCTEADSGVRQAADFQQLLSAAQGGDELAFNQLAERMHRYLLLVADRQLDSQLRRRVGASDLVQETLVRAEANLAQFEGASEGAFRAWLRQMVLHSASNARRRHRETEMRAQRREVALARGDSNLNGLDALPAPGETPSKLLSTREEEEGLLAALDCLRPRYRQVIELRSLERRTFREIGVTMDISEAAASKLWLRAIHHLRRHLQ